MSSFNEPVQYSTEHNRFYSHQCTKCKWEINFL